MIKISTTLLLVLSIGIHIDALGQVPSYVPGDGLQVWCGFNQFNGNYTDEAGVIENLSFIANVMDSTYDRFGISNKSPRFTTESSYLSANNSSGLIFPFTGGAEGLTISIWYKTYGEITGGVIADCSDEASGILLNGWRLKWVNAGNGQSVIDFSYINQGVDTCSIVAPVLNDIYGWHLVTVVVDAVGPRVYIDGAEANAQQITNWNSGSNFITEGFNEPLTLGNDQFADDEENWFNGRIDDIGIWNKALNQEQIEALYTEPAIAGCTNSNACNFNINMALEDNSCSFDCIGCLDPNACNYSANATIQDLDSCIYGCIQDTIVLNAFMDLNLNGTQDLNEGPLQYWPIRFTGVDSAQVYTDGNGFFVLPVQAGLYNFELIHTANGAEQWPSVNNSPLTPLIQSEVFPSSIDTLRFSFAPAASIEPSASAQLIEGFWSEYSCSSGYGQGILLQNTGGLVLNGLLVLDCDPGFTPGPDSSLSVQPTAVSPGHAEWPISNFLPGSETLMAFHVLTEDISSINSWNFNFHLELFDESLVPVLISDYPIDVTVNCDDSPAGVISADPPGVFEPNYILSGDTVTYRVAFRNDGPGTTNTVRLLINFNSQYFDLATIDVLSVSEAYVGCLHDDGTLDLFMENIHLPEAQEDSISSVGFALVKARLLDNIEGSQIIEVDPIIYLNENTVNVEPYRHTIFDCSSFIGPEGFTATTNPAYDETTGYLTQLNQTASSNFTLDFSSLNPYADYFIWSINGSPSDTTSSLQLNAEDLNNSGQPFAINLTIGNSLCQEEIEFELLIGLDELNKYSEMRVYPNPFTDNCTVILPDYNYSVSLIDVTGRFVRNWSSCSKTLVIDRESLQSGYYRMIADNGENRFSLPLIIE
jgi:hypothetical protein